MPKVPSHVAIMRSALRLARRAWGLTSPNPLVGAVLVKSGRIIGRGWHHRAGGPHAEVEAIEDARRRGFSCRGATLVVTLEPCCTQGRTPPCTETIVAAGIRRVIAATQDPNPRHAGRGFELLRRAGVSVVEGVLAGSAQDLNAPFNHWITTQTPFVTVKAAMTLDGKIATATGESKWITGPKARSCAMRLRLAADAVLVGVNTVLADNPRLTIRWEDLPLSLRQGMTSAPPHKHLRRIVLDSRARTPPSARIAASQPGCDTVIVVGPNAPIARVRRLEKHLTVWRAPLLEGQIDLTWLLHELGRAKVTHLLVEGGGKVNASFLLEQHAHRIAFFYAPKILGGRTALKAVEGLGARTAADVLQLSRLRWKRLDQDLLLTADLARKTDAPFTPA
ncbi:MAG TPA: bifunctional diaminohydroxyphosphoribosylaminopyrimidine deaminase/5-amino-6-(5-phosphoribosylamino)uracil reductase RibD [Candidatus Paceibacterota bacterium]|nr:bifunctional diaminohydroxyphosphoribosylaminopyrimidine deaminase/5-amino-6-(5-phosphoribosylamino)uracil reductase RibD [Candidatus Paceibacterota bacterium]HSA02769.1 bifunctional diaminohydroxyphosphoribosylaminopyrimidine deaminase/5-amino-6-(5-phosphoribosylamino)uracil reductase RibD [Candidatus Paceibacterota bacterium]